MVIQSKYNKQFISNDLTHLKYTELKQFAVFIQNHKNTVSEYVNNNLLHYLDYSKFDFVTQMRQLYKNTVPSSFDTQLYTEVFIAYQNKFKAIQTKLKFENTTFNGFEYYKHSAKLHKKGEFKKVLTKRYSTPLSICLTYLARYGNEHTMEYINTQLEKCDTKKKEFYLNMVRCCTKFGFDRLYRLAQSKRQHIISHYSAHPIVFKSLTFSGRSRKAKILNYNKHFGSKINAFISLSGLGR